MNKTTSTQSGYTCVRCGYFVLSGSTHTCWPNQQQYFPPMTDQRLITALERIADALEKCLSEIESQRKEDSK